MVPVSQMVPGSGLVKLSIFICGVGVGVGLKVFSGFLFSPLRGVTGTVEKGEKLVGGTVEKGATTVGDPVEKTENVVGKIAENVSKTSKAPADNIKDSIQFITKH